MQTLNFLLRHSRLSLVSAVVLGLLSGLGSTALLAILHSAVTGARGTGERSLALFLALCVFVAAARLGSQHLIDRTGQAAILQMRLRLAKEILAAPLRQLETIGSARLMTVLANDVGTVSNAASLAPLICINAALVLGGLVYLASLSAKLFWIFFGLIVIGGATYQLPMAIGARRLLLARKEQETLFEFFRGLVNGTKELKLSRGRERDFLAHYRESADRQRTLQLSANLIYGSASAWGYLLFFVVAGILVFLRPLIPFVAERTLVGFILVLLFLMNPLQSLLGTLAQLGVANVSLRRIEELGLSLSGKRKPAIAGQAATAETAVAPWQELRLEAVVHRYGDNGAERRAFTLGPLDLRFASGETVFIVGGNGSGKTTLAKLLLGLYSPTGGTIYTNDEPVDDRRRNDYRQSFSAVFSDFYLFDRLFGGLDLASQERARSYLQRLDLDGVIGLEDGRLSRLDVSRGQQKRLALLHCYLEERPVYLFDEWAADQDPFFKRVFYLEILPELKAKGKMVLVITHDDQYFQVADRIVRLEDGQVKFDGTPQHSAVERPPESVAS